MNSELKFLPALCLALYGSMDSSFLVFDPRLSEVNGILLLIMSSKSAEDKVMQSCRTFGISVGSSIAGINWVRCTDLIGSKLFYTSEGAGPLFALKWVSCGFCQMAVHSLACYLGGMCATEFRLVKLYVCNKLWLCPLESLEPDVQRWHLLAWSPVLRTSKESSSKCMDFPGTSVSGMVTNWQQTIMYRKLSFFEGSCWNCPRASERARILVFWPKF